MPIELVVKSDSVRLVISLRLHTPMRSFLIVSASMAIVITAIRAAIISQTKLLQHNLRQGQGPAMASMTTPSMKALVVRPALVMSVAMVIVVALVAVAIVALVGVPVVTTFVALFVILFVAVVLMLLLILALVVAVIVAAVIIAAVIVVAVIVIAVIVVAVIVVASLVRILLLPSVGSMHVVLVANVDIVSHVRSSVLPELIFPLNVLIGALRLHGPAARIVVEAAIGHLLLVPRWWFPPPVEELVHRHQVVVTEAIERPRVMEVVPCHIAQRCPLKPPSP